MCGNAWVCVGRSEEVESDHGLGNETIPFLGCKVGVVGGESGANMVFECTDCTFGGVAVVGVRNNNLEVNVYLRKALCMVWENSLSRMWRVITA